MNLNQLADLAFGEILGSQSTPDAQCLHTAGATDHPPAMGDTTPRTGPPAGSHHQQAMDEAQPSISPPAGGPDSPPDMLQAQPIASSPAGPNFLSARGISTPTQVPPTGPTSQPAKAETEPQSGPLAGPILADPVLGIHADTVDEIEQLRIATANRLRQLTDTSEHGHGLTDRHPEVRRLAAMVEQFEDLEHQAVLNLQRAMRKHPSARG